MIAMNCYDCYGCYDYYAAVYIIHMQHVYDMYIYTCICILYIYMMYPTTLMLKPEFTNALVGIEGQVIRVCDYTMSTYLFPR